MGTFQLSRREVLQSAACGFGGLALTGMMGGATQAANPLAIRAPHYGARANRMIFIFLAGGPSQADLFAPKEEINKQHGQAIKSPVGDDGQIRVGVKEFLPMAPVASVRPRGDAGLMISDLMPSLASVADDLCMLRAVASDNRAHSPATLQFHTGHIAEARPSMGAWISYGLGSANENLPSFLTIHPLGDSRLYGSSDLPALHQGTPLRVPQNSMESAIADLQNLHSKPAAQRHRLDFLQNLNQRLLDRLRTDSQMEGIIESFELAFRMQMETPEVVDISTETEETLRLYGIGEKSAGGPENGFGGGMDIDHNGRACLMARQLTEAGVRFVQVTIGGWDHHADIHNALRGSCAAADKPIGGLISDLKRRGLLDDTLVMVSGEFGRTYWSQDLSGKNPILKHGREHQQESFCTLLTGGGVKRGFVYGETDDLGYQPISGRIHLHDLHATLLHLLGMNHEQLIYPHHGRDLRLTDVFGNVVNEIMA